MNSHGRALSRVLAYRRISIATEESGSLSKQTAQVRAWVESKGGDPEAVVWFTDESVSGSKRGIRRPGREGLLAAVKAGDTVAVTKIDRLARSVKDLLTITEDVKAAGAALVFTEDAINTDGPYGQFLLVLLGAIAQLEAEITGERLKASRVQFHNEGRHPGGDVPMGWRLVPNEGGKGLRVEVDPSEGPRVREAVLAILNGASYGSQADILGLSDTGMGKLFRSVRLGGFTPKGESGVVVGKDGLPLYDERAALLTPGQYKAVRDRVSGPKREQSIRKNLDGYGQALICPGCGGPLYISKQKAQQDRYKCPGSKAHRLAGTRQASINRAPVDAYLEEWFLTAQGDRPYVVLEWDESGEERGQELQRVNVGVEQATERLTAAREPGERQEALQVLQELLTERDRVEALPVQRKPVARDTGLTMRHLWERADAMTRTRMLRTCGGWLVLGGRGPVEDRLIFDPAKASEEQFWMADL